MQNLMTPDLANAFVAEAERRWLYGHPYRVERPRRHPALGRRRAAARARRTAARAPQRLRAA